MAGDIDQKIFNLLDWGFQPSELYRLDFNEMNYYDNLYKIKVESEKRELNK